MESRGASVAATPATSPSLEEAAALDPHQSQFWTEENYAINYKDERGFMGSRWDALMCRMVFMHAVGFGELDPPNRRVLDVGCGAGHFLKLMQGYFHCDVLGLDPAPAARRRALEEVGAASLRPEATPSEAGLPDDHFGTVALIHALEHVPDPHALLQDIHRVAAPERSSTARSPTAITSATGGRSSTAGSSPSRRSTTTCAPPGSRWRASSRDARCHGPSRWRSCRGWRESADRTAKSTPTRSACPSGARGRRSSPAG